MNRSHSRASTQDSSRWALPLQVLHSHKSQCDRRPLEVCRAPPAQLGNPCSEACCFFVLATGAMVHGGHNLQARNGQTHQLLQLSIEPVIPFPINNLTPCQNGLCAGTLGFIQNLVITTLYLSQICFQSCSFLEQGSLFLPLWGEQLSSVPVPTCSPLQLGPRQLPVLDECSHLLHI